MLTIKTKLNISWALADQAMVSAVNFLTGILLTRFLGLENFGIFTLVWSGVLFIQAIQMAILVNPMMTIGVKSKNNDYFGAMFSQQILFLLLCFSVLLAIGFINKLVLSSEQLDYIFIPLTFSSLTYLMQDFLRRYLFTINKGYLAFLNDAISYLGQLTLLIFSFIYLEMTIIHALWVIGGTSFVAIIIGVRSFPVIIFNRKIIQSIFNKNWLFSKWLLNASIAQWLSGNLFLLGSGFWIGATAVGAMKAVQNIMGIAHILFQGFENVIPISCARIYSLNGISATLQYLKRVSLIGFSLVVIGVLIISAKPSFWLELFYGQEFLEFTNLLVWCSLTYPVVFLSLMLRILLRTVEETKKIFKSYFVMSFAGLILVYPLTKYIGVNGAMIGVLITNIIMVMSLMFAYISSSRKSSI